MVLKSELSLPSLPFILLAKTLLPSDISILKESPVRGVVLQEGNNTSHVAILLRSAGIPSIIIQSTLSPSKTVILDANSGQLILSPTKADFQKSERLKKEFFEEQDRSFNTRNDIAQTLSGQKIKVLANITNLETAKEAKEQGADGIGLFRTEFLFTEYKPSIEEQTHAYKEVFEVFDDITIRTLDIGGDKSLPYINIAKEDNPFLGIRGIRFSLQEQTLFKEQLLAIFQAVGSISSNNIIKVMFPMVSTTQEFIEAKEIAQEVAKEHKLDISNIQFGIMLEVPSVIFALKEFDKLVDFYSIGSNDLTQYLFAIERTHPSLKVDSTSPMLMSALKQIIKTTEKPVSICGELAGLEEATQELIEMGYQTLSVSAKLIPSLKERIRNV
jgi:phosphocarrier protein FPr